MPTAMPSKRRLHAERLRLPGRRGEQLVEQHLQRRVDRVDRRPSCAAGTSRSTSTWRTSSITCEPAYHFCVHRRAGVGELAAELQRRLLAVQELRDEVRELVPRGLAAGRPRRRPSGEHATAGARRRSCGMNHSSRGSGMRPVDVRPRRSTGPSCRARRGRAAPRPRCRTPTSSAGRAARRRRAASRSAGDLRLVDEVDDLEVADLAAVLGENRLHACEVLLWACVRGRRRGRGGSSALTSSLRRRTSAGARRSAGRSARRRTRPTRSGRRWRRSASAACAGRSPAGRRPALMPSRSSAAPARRRCGACVVVGRLLLGQRRRSSSSSSKSERSSSRAYVRVLGEHVDDGVDPAVEPLDRRAAGGERAHQRAPRCARGCARRRRRRAAPCCGSGGRATTCSSPTASATSARPMPAKPRRANSSSAQSRILSRDGCRGLLRAPSSTVRSVPDTDRSVGSQPRRPRACGSRSARVAQHREHRRPAAGADLADTSKPCRR